MRTRPLVLLGVAATLSVTACAAPGGTSPADAARDAVRTIDPGELVDLWRVSDAEGEAPETWLRLEPGTYDVGRECGYVGGGWAASDDGLFIASAPVSTSGPCTADGWPTADWLSQARSAERTSDGWRLLDQEGDALATLTIDGMPEPHKDADESRARAPEVTDEVRDALAEPASLPSSLVPATTTSVLGRWEVPEDTSGSFLELAEDGTYTSSDGCNQMAGVWTIGPGGRVLVTAGSVTLAACDGYFVGGWFAWSGRVGFDGSTLVTIDRAGAELGRLVRR